MCIHSPELCVGKLEQHRIKGFGILQEDTFLAQIPIAADVHESPTVGLTHYVPGADYLPSST